MREGGRGEERGRRKDLTVITLFPILSNITQYTGARCPRIARCWRITNKQYKTLEGKESHHIICHLFKISV